ncbi:MAG: FG-GAP repeat domain-containing protein [Pirellulaceae bacterium]
MKTLLTCLMTLFVAIAAHAAEPIFIPVKIDGPVHDPANDDWTFHDDYQFHILGNPQWRTAASHPMIVHDVNSDGLNDIIVGAAHHYGLAWLEQGKGPDGKRSFTQHWVETEYGQFHTMAWGDLDGDGQPDLLTGKRLFSHHVRDVSCYEPLFAFWYDMKGGTLNRHILAFNHFPKLDDNETRRNPPPNFVPAVGIKVHIVDIDADGHNDAVICGKGGLYVFYHRGEPPRDRPKHRLLPEDSYPTWERWGAMPMPLRPAEIPLKIHGDGPAPMPPASKKGK